MAVSATRNRVLHSSRCNGHGAWSDRGRERLPARVTSLFRRGEAAQFVEKVVQVHHVTMCLIHRSINWYERDDTFAVRGDIVSTVDIDIREPRLSPRPWRIEREGIACQLVRHHHDSAIRTSEEQLFRI